LTPTLFGRITGNVAFFSGRSIFGPEVGILRNLQESGIIMSSSTSGTKTGIGHHHAIINQWHQKLVSTILFLLTPGGWWRVELQSSRIMVF
jgi:hypothetical protein